MHKDKDSSTTRCSFNGCPEKPLAMSQYCWDHLPDKKSYVSGLIEAINKGDSFSGANLRKVSLKNAFIEKANLRNAEMCQSDLSGSRFFDSDLNGAELIGSNMSEADLSHCKLIGSDLTKARMAGCRLWNSQLTDANLIEADLSGADLWDTNLHNAKLWHTIFAGAKSMSKASFSCDSKFFNRTKINEDGVLSAEEAYRGIKQYFISSGMYTDASWASFKEKSMERRVLKKRGDWNYLPSLLMNVLCGYGEKPYRIILTAFLTILSFAALYSSFGTVQMSCNPSYAMRWYDYIYYSAITFTTVGYGDFVPKATLAFRMMAAAEAFCGVFVTGLFIFTLARKYSAR